MMAWPFLVHERAGFLRIKKDMMSLKHPVYLCFFLAFSLSACQGGEPEDPPVEPHQENWAVFLRKGESGPSIITIDLGWKGVAPLQYHNKLLVVTVLAEDEQNAGFPDEEEVRVANRLQDQLIRSLEKSGQGIFVGSSTSFGQKNFFFYLTDSRHSEKIARQVLVSFDSRKTNIEVRGDFRWAAYFNVLYPSEKELDEIRNERVLSSLQDAGDPLQEPRSIEHWLRFPSIEQGSHFMKEAQEDGFKYLEMDTQAGGERPYVFHITRKDSIHIPYIHELTWGLREKAEKYDGVYDGWETVVAR